MVLLIYEGKKNKWRIQSTIYIEHLKSLFSGHSVFAENASSS